MKILADTNTFLASVPEEPEKEGTVASIYLFRASIASCSVRLALKELPTINRGTFQCRMLLEQRNYDIPLKYFINWTRS